MRIPKTPLDRATALIATIVDSERDDCIAGLIKLITMMSASYGLASRIKIANTMRDAADKIENAHVKSVPFEARN